MHFSSPVKWRVGRAMLAVACLGLLTGLALPQAGLGQAPTITRQPVGGFAGVGESFRFSLLVAGTEPFTYAWQFQGKALAGATNATLLLTNLTTSQAGNYSVIVSNSVGRAVSSNATLSVQAEVARRLGTSRIFQLGMQVGAPIILRANGQENAVSFSLSYDTNAYSSPAFLTIYSNAVVNLDLSQSGVAGVALTLPAGETFRPGYRLVGLVRFDLAGGYTPVQGGLAFATNPIPIAAVSPEGASLQLSAGVQPQHVLSTTNAELNLQSGLYEHRLVISNPSSTVMTNVNLAVYGLGVDSRSNVITLFNAQSILETCPLNDCQIYVECDCTCDFYDPFWGFCYGYVYCSDDDCNTYETGTTVSTPYVQINHLLPGESRQVTLEYYVSDHATVPRPIYSAFLDDPLLRVLPGDTTALSITGCLYTNQVFLVQFNTRLGFEYYIQYAATPQDLSTNGPSVRTAFPLVTGTGGSVVWIDSGPPKTESLPVNGARFYHVRRREP